MSTVLLGLVVCFLPQVGANGQDAGDGERWSTMGGGGRVLAAAPVSEEEEGQRSQRRTLGITISSTTRDASDGRRDDRSGESRLRVDSVQDDSPAARGGLRMPRGCACDYFATAEGLLGLRGFTALSEGPTPAAPRVQKDKSP